MQKNNQTDFPLHTIPLTQIQVEDNFWSRRIETNRTVTILYAFKKCAELGRMDNFAIAGGLNVASTTAFIRLMTATL